MGFVDVCNLWNILFHLIFCLDLYMSCLDCFLLSPLIGWNKNNNDNLACNFEKLLDQRLIWYQVIIVFNYGVWFCIWLSAITSLYFCLHIFFFSFSVSDVENNIMLFKYEPEGKRLNWKKFKFFSMTLTVSLLTIKTDDLFIYLFIFFLIYTLCEINPW